MAKDRTDVSNYPSRYSPSGWVTSAQYIIELVCEQRARHLKKDLPVLFWNLPEWSSFYRSQLRAIHKLLGQYDERAIIAAIKEKKLRTLFPKWVNGAIAQEQKKLDGKRLAVEAKEAENQEDIKQPKSPEPVIIEGQRGFRPRSRQNLLALDDFDEESINGKEEEGGG